MLRFSIIIVSWNALPHLKTFFPSVAATNYRDFEIILADNASTDDSKIWVEQHFPKVKIVTFDDNYGYCGGNNRAVPYATGDILLFLNNDVKVDANWLAPLSQLFEDHSDIAAAQPKLRSYKNPHLFEYAGASGGYLDRYGFPFCRGRVFDTLEADEGQYDDITDIFWASGAAFAIRKEAFQQQGGFDEDFEFHMEEIDLCWRLWNQGFKVAACPESLVYHLGGGSLPMHSPRKTYYNYRNSLVMLWKNYAALSLITRFPVRVILDNIAALVELISGDVASFKAIMQGQADFWRSFRKTSRKRRKLQQKRTNNANPNVMYPINVVWRYFMNKKKRFSKLTDKITEG